MIEVPSWWLALGPPWSVHPRSVAVNNHWRRGNLIRSLSAQIPLTPSRGCAPLLDLKHGSVRELRIVRFHLTK
jgi:hypothetical protein